MESTIHTFEKEMHLDNAPEAQPEGTARYIRNKRIADINGSHFSLVDINGTAVSGEVNQEFTPIQILSFLDYMLVFSLNSNLNRGEIGLFTTLKGSRTGAYTPLYVHENLNFSLDNTIEGRVIRETEDRHMAYFWDNRNPMRVFNAIDKTFTTVIASGSLVTNQQYMVVEGVVTYNGIDYGPLEASTVFTCTLVGGTAYTGTGRVIIYIPVQTFSVIKKTGFNVPRATARIAGSLTCGTYYVFYRPTDINGNGPEWSMPSAPIYISLAPLRFAGDARYLDADMDGGQNNITSPWGVRMTVDYIDPIFTHIEVAYMKAIDGETFEDPYLFDRLEITGSSMSFDLVSNTGTSFSAEDLIRGQLSIVKNKTGSINKNILFISDYEVIPDPEFDMSATASVSDIRLDIPCDETEVTLNGQNPNLAATEFAATGIFNTPLYGVYRTPTGGIPPLNDWGGPGYANQWYELTAGSIRLFNSSTGATSGVITGPTYFQWTLGFNQWQINSGFPEVYPVIRIQKYTNNFQYVRIENDYFSNSGMLVNHYIRTGKRSETYRIGIALTDVIGNPKYVHHLFDYSFDDFQAIPLAGSIDLSNGVGASRQWKHFLTNLGITISGLDFNKVVDGLKVVYDDNTLTLADIPTYFDGFSIVMCKRDKQIIGEGLLFPISPYFSSYVKASHPVAQYCQAWYKSGNRILNAFALQSPEAIFNVNENPYEVEEGDFLEILTSLDLVNNTRPNKRGTLIQASTAGIDSYSYYMKLFGVGSTAYAGARNMCDPEYCHIYKSAKDTFFFGPNKVNMTYRGALTDSSGPATPFTSTAAPLGDCENTRNACAFFWTREDTASTLFGWPEAWSDPATPITPVYAALKKTKNNLYGGTGSLAKSQNEYFFCGHYQRFDSAFMTYLNGNAGVCDNLEIYGFDAFMQLCDMSVAYHSATSIYPGLGIHMILPVQSDCLLRYREGRNFAHERIHPNDSNGVNFQYDPGYSGNPYNPEQFVLNKAYRSTSAWNIPLNAVPYGYIPRRFYDKEIAFSLKKTDGEFRDNLRRFLPGNTLSLESQNGKVTNLYTKGGVLIYIQELSMGYIPVEERVTVANAIGAPVGIGTNDTINRYEQTNTYHGSRHQFSLVETEDSIYFYDATAEAICQAKINGESVELTTFKGLWSLFKNIFAQIPVEDTPLNYKGVVAGYDNENKELLFTFWGLVTNADSDAYTSNYLTVAINSITGNIRYINDLAPRMYVNHNKNLFSIAPDERYPAIQNSTFYTEGTIVKDAGILYIALLPITTAAPYIPPASDSTWAEVRKFSDIHAHNRGDICKFHGLVFPSEVSLVVTGKYKRDSYFNNYQLNINDSGVMYDELTIENNRQSGTDTDVANSPDHTLVDDHVEGNYPLDNATGERITGNYAIVTLRKNHAIDPVTSNNEKSELTSFDNITETAY